MAAPGATARRVSGRRQSASELAAPPHQDGIPTSTPGDVPEDTQEKNTTQDRIGPAPPGAMEFGSRAPATAQDRIGPARPVAMEFGSRALGGCRSGTTRWPRADFFHRRKGHHEKEE